jgi:methyl-accepting chemotaxis protein
MNWFYNLRTGAKLHIGFGLMAVFLAATAVIAVLTMNRLQDSMEDTYQRDFNCALDLAEIRSALNLDRANMLSLHEAQPGPARERIMEDLARSSAELDAKVRSLTVHAGGDAALAPRIAELKEAIAQYRTFRTQQLDAIASDPLSNVAVNDQKAEKMAYENVRTICIGIGEETKARAADGIRISGEHSDRSKYTFVGVAAGAFLFAISIALLLNRAIAGPLLQISGMAERIASGDLSVDVPRSGRNDEVGVMQGTFSKMVGGLRDITRQMRDATGVLAASATEIMAATTQLASSAAETASAVAQTTTTLEEVKQTSQVSSQKAKSVSDEARRAAEVATVGRQSVEQAIGGMEGIQRQMSAIAESIINLSTQSQAIGEIITSVDDIAAQSKLLAVNASIEAAKAGAEGKGFSVVAQEVKSLAEQSKQATAQVRSILSDIQKATGNAVLATEQGGKAVEAGVTQSARAGESISALTENITQAAQAATQIAATSQQQYVGVDQVALAMESIKTASTQTVASTRQAEAAAQQLHELGQNLKMIVERFKV